MYATYRRNSDSVFPARPQVRVAPRSFSPAVASPAVSPADHSRFGERRTNWLMIAATVMLHVVLIAALVKMEVIPLSKPKPQRTIVELIPLPVADIPPPPAPAKAPTPKTEAPVEQRIVAPKTLVETPIARAPVVAVLPEAVKPTPIAPPAPSTAGVPAAAPAPITAPDAFAANLGNPAPKMPMESRRRREQGTVRLRVVITADGRVKEIGLAKSSGFERLDDAALEAVRKWKFRPGMQAGQPVEAVGTVPITFRLAN